MALTVAGNNYPQQKDIIVKKQKPQKTQIVITLFDDSNSSKKETTFTCVNTNVAYVDQTNKNPVHKWITGGVKNIICRTQQEFQKWVNDFEKLAGKNDRTIDKEDQARFNKMQIEQDSQDSVRIGDFEIGDFEL